MSHAEIDNFRTEIRPPIFENQNSKILLHIYIYYVTIMCRNKMHKIKTERGVDVTRKCDGQTDRQTDGEGRSQYP